jgi:hypothetical protein
MGELTEATSHRPGRAPAPGRLLLAVAILVSVATAGTAADAATAWTVQVGSNAPAQARGGTLAAPSGVTSACASNKVPVIVSWNAVANATSYGITQAPTSTGPFTPVATGITGTSYSFTPSSAGTYFYEVFATRSTWSGPASAPTLTPRTVGSGGNCS